MFVDLQKALSMCVRVSNDFMYREKSLFTDIRFFEKCRNSGKENFKALPLAQFLF